MKIDDIWEDMLLTEEQRLNKIIDEKEKEIARLKERMREMDESYVLLDAEKKGVELRADIADKKLGKIKAVAEKEIARLTDSEDHFKTMWNEEAKDHQECIKAFENLELRLASVRDIFYNGFHGILDSRARIDFKIGDYKMLKELLGEKHEESPPRNILCNGQYLRDDGYCQYHHVMEYLTKEPPPNAPVTGAPVSKACRGNKGNSADPHALGKQRPDGDGKGGSTKPDPIAEIKRLRTIIIGENDECDNCSNAVWDPLIGCGLSEDDWSYCTGDGNHIYWNDATRKKEKRGDEKQ